MSVYFKSKSSVLQNLEELQVVMQQAREENIDLRNNPSYKRQIEKIAKIQKNINKKCHKVDNNVYNVLQAVHGDIKKIAPHGKGSNSLGNKINKIFINIFGKEEKIAFHEKMAAIELKNSKVVEEVVQFFNQHRKPMFYEALSQFLHSEDMKDFFQEVICHLLACDPTWIRDLGEMGSSYPSEDERKKFLQILVDYAFFYKELVQVLKTGDEREIFCYLSEKYPEHLAYGEENGLNLDQLVDRMLAKCDFMPHLIQGVNQSKLEVGMLCFYRLLANKVKNKEALKQLVQQCAQDKHCDVGMPHLLNGIVHTASLPGRGQLLEDFLLTGMLNDKSASQTTLFKALKEAHFDRSTFYTVLMEILLANIDDQPGRVRAIIEQFIEADPKAAKCLAEAAIKANSQELWEMLLDITKDKRDALDVTKDKKSAFDVAKEERSALDAVLDAVTQSDLYWVAGEFLHNPKLSRDQSLGFLEQARRLLEYSKTVEKRTGKQSDEYITCLASYVSLVEKAAKKQWSNDLVDGTLQETASKEQWSNCCWSDATIEEITGVLKSLESIDSYIKKQEQPLKEKQKIFEEKIQQLSALQASPEETPRGSSSSAGSASEVQSLDAATIRKLDEEIKALGEEMTKLCDLKKAHSQALDVIIDVIAKVESIASFRNSKPTHLTSTENIDRQLTLLDCISDNEKWLKGVGAVFNNYSGGDTQQANLREYVIKNAMKKPSFPCLHSIENFAKFRTIAMCDNETTVRYIDEKICNYVPGRERQFATEVAYKSMELEFSKLSKEEQEKRYRVCSSHPQWFEKDSKYCTTNIIGSLIKNPKMQGNLACLVGRLELLKDSTHARDYPKFIIDLMSVINDAKENDYLISRVISRSLEKAKSRFAMNPLPTAFNRDSPPPTVEYLQEEVLPWLLHICEEVKEYLDHQNNRAQGGPTASRGQGAVGAGNLGSANGDADSSTSGGLLGRLTGCFSCFGRTSLPPSDDGHTGSGVDLSPSSLNSGAGLAAIPSSSVGGSQSHPLPSSSKKSNSNSASSSNSPLSIKQQGKRPLSDGSAPNSARSSRSSTSSG